MTVAQIMVAIEPAAIDLVRKSGIMRHDLLDIVRGRHHEVELSRRKRRADWK
ncbi:MAG: hypothetical protein ABI668_12570 [Sphingorhabdus sp.]